MHQATELLPFTACHFLMYRVPCLHVNAGHVPLTLQDIQTSESDAKDVQSAHKVHAKM